MFNRQFRRNVLFIGISAALLASSCPAHAATLDGAEAARLIDRVAQQTTTTRSDARPAISADGTVSALGIHVKAEGFSGQSTSHGTLAMLSSTTDHMGVRFTDKGTQILTVSEASAPRTHDFTFTGLALQPRPDGSVLVRASDQGAPLALVEAPWAKDSQGKPVQTSYEVMGSTLRQVITPDADTVFPVVADPHINKEWWGVNIELTRNETLTVAGGVGACTAWMAAAPEPLVSKTAAAICGVASAFFGTAAASGKCMSVKVPYVGPPVPWITDCTSKAQATITAVSKMGDAR